MKTLALNKIVCCPRCKSKISLSKLIQCKRCGFEIAQDDEIWNLSYISSKETKVSKSGYENLHRRKSGGPKDGSYEILASIARGNKTLDIASGEGIIEKLSPDTVGIDFSINALKKAQRNGVKNIIQANSEYLPFKDNSFDISICNGSLEHFSDPQKALNEMARVSKIQVITVHKEFNLPFSRYFRVLIENLTNLENQPIEVPLSIGQLEKMYLKANLHIVYKGVWTFPINFGKAISYFPTLDIPSCHFIISYKK